MILLVTLNPVLDTTFFVDEFRPVYRTEAHRVTAIAGGKGSNVARALRALGVPAGLVIALGGATGRRVAELLAAEGTRAAVAWVGGETRLQVTVVDRQNEQRSYYAPAAPFSAADVAEVCRQYDALLPEAQAVCICGSSPGEGADVLFAELLTLARARGLATLLDSSGAGLRHGVRAGPRIVKVNRAEAAGLLGRELMTSGAEIAALSALRGWGSEWAILTLGERGALFATGECQWCALPPPVAAINPIGSGDAMTAGLMAGLCRGWSPEACFRLGMAAAAANTLTWDACAIVEADVERLARQIDLVQLPASSSPQ